MKTTSAIPALLALLMGCGPCSAQDLVISNARIIDGTGRTLERGTLVIREGRIASVAAVEPGTPAVAGVEEIDAGGLTLLPGLIDTHRHDLLGGLQAFSRLSSDAEVRAAIRSDTPVRLRTLLDEGFTTVMMPGVFLSAGLEVRRLLEQGVLEGPRLLFSGPGFTAPADFPVRGMVCGDNSFCAARVAFQVTDPEVARDHVRTLARSGADGIKVFVDGEGAELDEAVLAAIAEQSRALGLPTLLHAHRVEDMLAGVRMGATRLVHTPGDVPLAGTGGARVLREAGAAVATTVSFGSPQFAQAMGFEYRGAARHQQVLENVKHLVGAGVMVAFGTDSPDGIRPMVEVEQLSTVLEPAQVIALLTRNAATFVGLEREIGTLEPGKVADVVVVDGNPLVDVRHLARVQLVLQSGRVVVDKRP